MKKIFIRLDDACPKRDITKWDRMEFLLDKYSIKPLVGIIPDCRDQNMNCYEEDKSFWTRYIPKWQKKGWILAMHGYQHVFNTKEGGINPVNKMSEFAGLPIEKQKEMLREGISILRNHGINPDIFFAPAHTFDRNTLLALKSETNVSAISDTPANDTYYYHGFTFIPQQSGYVRNLPFRTITFCYHPNTMKDRDFATLENYITKRNISNFEKIETNRTLSLFDRCLMCIYYSMHK